MDEAALLAANEAYYRAFAARDLGAMEALWAETGVSCVHPGWPALIGRAPVIASYRDIFRNPLQTAVTARDERTLIEGDEGRVFCVEEVGGGLLLATNWFRLISRRLAAAASSGEPARVVAGQEKPESVIPLIWPVRPRRWPSGKSCSPRMRKPAHKNGRLPA